MPFPLFVENMLFDVRMNPDEHKTKIYYLLSGMHAKKLVLYRRRPSVKEENKHEKNNSDDTLPCHSF